MENDREGIVMNDDTTAGSPKNASVLPVTPAKLPAPTLTREQVEAIREERAELLADLDHDSCGHCDELAEVVALCDTALAHTEKAWLWDGLVAWMDANYPDWDITDSDGSTIVTPMLDEIRKLTEERDRLRDFIEWADRVGALKGRRVQTRLRAALEADDE
jgi:hypothetical protein